MSADASAHLNKLLNFLLSFLLCFNYSCAVSNLKKVSLELGGKSPLIIFADCDMDKAVRMVSSFSLRFFVLNLASRLLL